MNLNELLMAVLTALSGGLTVALVVSRLRFMPVSSQALATYMGAEAPPTFVEKLGQRVMKRVSVGGVEGWRQWVALEGTPTSVAYLMGLSLILGSGGVALSVATRIPALALLGLVGFAWPFVRLRSRANGVRKRVQRSLPEMATLMAAEMAAANPPDKALERVGDWGGPLSAIVKEAIEETRTTGRPLLGHVGMPGALQLVAQRYDLPPLRAFASQVVLVARKGAGGPELMDALASTLIIAYKSEALRQAEQLDNRLAAPGVLFFFLPFLFLILAPMLIPLLKIL